MMSNRSTQDRPLGRVSLHRMALSESSAAEGLMVPSSGGHVFASRASRIALSPGSSVFPASAVPASLISLRATEVPGDPGDGPLWYSGPELPLASAVQRRAGNGRGGELSLAESPGAPGELGRGVTIGAETPLVTDQAPPAPPAAGVDIEELFDRVVRRLVREVAIERERRGFTPWL